MVFWFCFFCFFSSGWGIESYSFQICKTSGNTDTLYGYLYDFELGQRIATSTTAVTVSSTCTSYSTSTVSFSSYAFKDKKWYGVILGRADGSYSGTYYWRIKNYGNGSFVNKYFVDTAFGDYISIADFYKFGGLVSFYVSNDDEIFGCTSGVASSTIECDMATATLAIASNTEAIYATGYVNAWFFGFVSFVFFLVVGYFVARPFFKNFGKNL